MRVLMLNGGSSGSSWDILTQIAKGCIDNQWDVLVCAPTRRPANFDLNYYQIGKGKRIIHNLLSKIDGSDGFHNKKATRMLIDKIISFKPDIVHLHTLHGYFIDIKMLCDFLKKNNIYTIITLHDCWYFTGRCVHFTKNKCSSWVDGCHNCSFKKTYPKALLIDNCSKFYEIKENIFANWNNLRVVAVSNWLAETANKSKIFRGKVHVTTIYNGVDTSVFCDKNRNYNINLSETINIICVASSWNERKGISIINYIAQHLPDNFKITLVGSTGDLEVNKKICCIGKVTTKEQLVSLYLNNDFLLNPSSEETFSLVNIEAQACGSRVICYPATGIKETSNSRGNVLVKKYDKDAFLYEILNLKKNPSLSKECAKFAESFSLNNMVDNYISIYKEAKNE